jgi:hypothetical protein
MATHAGLKLGPAFICRCSEPAGLHEFLSEQPLRQAYVVNSNSAAVVFREDAFGTIEALGAHMRTVELHAGSLLEVRAASTGALVFSKTARGVRGAMVVDTLRLVGCPATWGPREFDGFSGALRHGGSFTGSFKVERPLKPDGSALEQVRDVLGLVSSIQRLVHLQSVSVASPGRPCAVVQFQEVSETFRWTTAGDADWHIVVTGSYQSQGTRGRENGDSAP